MNPYHCTKCNAGSVMRNSEKEVKVKCCDGENPVLHKLGKAPVKVAIPEPKPAPTPKVQEAPRQETKLDVVGSGVPIKTQPTTPKQS